MGHLNPRDLLDAEVRTLFTLTANGRLHSINEPQGGEAPRAFVGRTKAGVRSWYRGDLTWEMIRTIEVLARTLPDGVDAVPPAVIDEVARTIGSGTEAKTWSGPSFVVSPASRWQATQVTQDNVHLLDPHLSSWRPDLERGQPLWMVVQNDAAVSICGSVRVGEQAHEAGVETAEEYRGRGFGGRAVVAWAIAVAALDKFALYSTSWSNLASRRLAERLGFDHFASIAHVT